MNPSRSTQPDPVDRHVWRQLPDGIEALEVLA